MLILEQLPFASYNPEENQRAENPLELKDLASGAADEAQAPKKSIEPFGTRMTVTIRHLGGGAVSSKPKISYDTEGYPGDTTYLDPVK